MLLRIFSLLTKRVKYQCKYWYFGHFSKNKLYCRVSVRIISLLVLLFTYFEFNKTTKRTTVLWLFPLYYAYLYPWFYFESKNCVLPFLFFFIQTSQSRFIIIICIYMSSYYFFSLEIDCWLIHNFHLSITCKGLTQKP